MQQKPLIVTINLGLIILGQLKQPFAKRPVAYALFYLDFIKNQKTRGLGLCCTSPLSLASVPLQTTACFLCTYANPFHVRLSCLVPLASIALTTTLTATLTSTLTVAFTTFLLLLPPSLPPLPPAAEATRPRPPHTTCTRTLTRPTAAIQISFTEHTNSSFGVMFDW